MTFALDAIPAAEGYVESSNCAGFGEGSSCPPGRGDLRSGRRSTYVCLNRGGDLNHRFLGQRVCEQLCPAMRTSSGELPLTGFVAGPSTGRRHPHLLTQPPQVSRSSSRRRTTLAVSTSSMLGCTGGPQLKPGPKQLCPHRRHDHTHFGAD